jgi:MATE family multidrug resistance protein
MSASSPIPARSADELRILLRLALPLALAQAGQALHGARGHRGGGRGRAVQLAGAALGNAVVFTMCIVGIGTLMGADPLISQAIGARDRCGRGASTGRPSAWRWRRASCSCSPPSAGLPPRALRHRGRRRPGRARLRLVASPGHRRAAGLLCPAQLRCRRGRGAGAGLGHGAGQRAQPARGSPAGLRRRGLPAWTGPLRWIPPMGAGGSALATSLVQIGEVLSSPG